ncbi:hypothetical protein [Halocatena salina]|uniref:hypothetical protein n=1 Tax=Halocatena salina TaxID=2934340 RepID=UPI0034A3B059
MRPDRHPEDEWGKERKYFRWIRSSSSISIPSDVNSCAIRSNPKIRNLEPTEDATVNLAHDREHFEELPEPPESLVYWVRCG